MNKDTNTGSVHSAEDMARIQKGLEEFLRREMQGMEQDRNRRSDVRHEEAEPHFFTIDEEDEQEEEIDIIGMRTDRRVQRQEEYYEDWDSREKNRRKTDSRHSSVTQNASKNKDRKLGKKQKAELKGTHKNTNKKGKKYQSEEEQEIAIKKPKKKSKFKRFLRIVAVLLVLFMVGLYYLVGMVYNKMHYEEIDSVATRPMKEEGVINVLLIGNDSRKGGEDGRSDAMILVSVSNKTKKIYMTSLLRDMYVEIPGHKNNRLNSAYSYGGAELLMETVEKNFDIEVNRYALVNFEAFANLVDVVGGVELELTSEEIEYVNGYLVEYNMLLDRPQGTDNMDPSVSGLVHLNGAQALAYTRNRYLGTDFGRTERQRKVLNEMIRKLPMAMVKNPTGVTEGLFANLTTNLTQAECYRLSLMAPKILGYEIVQGSIPIEGTYKNATIRKMSVLEVDFEANKKFIRDNIYGEGVAQDDASIEVTP